MDNNISKSETAIKPAKPEVNLRALISKMVENIYLDTPEDITSYMLNYLKKDQGMTSSGLTREEMTELDKLRYQKVRYKQLDEYNKQQPLRDDDYITDDDSDDYDEALSDPKEIEKRMAVTPRMPIKLESSEEKDVDNERTENQNARNEKEPKKDAKQKQREKTEEEKAADRVKEDIRLRLSRLFMFEDFDEDDFNNVISAMTQRKVSEGLNIIKQDEQNETMFYIAEGFIECYRQPSKDKKALLIKELIKGDIVGELGLLRKNGFIATLTVVKDAVVYCLSRKDFVAARKQSIEKRMKMKESLIRKAKLFEDLEQKDVIKLATLFKEGVYSQGETIYKSGQYGDVMYIIEKGECVALKADEPGKLETEGEVFKYGSVFGENALLLGEVRDETLIAKSDVVKVIGVDRETIRSVYGSVEALLKTKYDEVMEVKRKEEEEKIKKEEDILKEIQRQKEEAERLERERLARIEEEKYVAVGKEVKKKQVKKKMKDNEKGFDDDDKGDDDGNNSDDDDDDDNDNDKKPKHNNDNTNAVGESLHNSENNVDNDIKAENVEVSQSEHFENNNNKMKNIGEEVSQHEIEDNNNNNMKNIGEEVSQHEIEEHNKSNSEPKAYGEVNDDVHESQNIQNKEEQQQRNDAESIHESNKDKDEDNNNNNNNNDASENEAEFMQEEEEVVNNADNEEFKEHNNSQHSNNNNDNFE